MDLRGLLNFFSTTYLKRVDSVLQKYNEDLPFRLLPYIMKNMWPGENPAGRNAPNTTDKLYRRTGTLVSALRKGGTGNISRVTRTDSKVALDYGIDVSAVPYAMFHELGTSKMRARPYLTPGIEEFRQKALIDIQTQVYNDLIAEWEKG